MSSLIASSYRGLRLDCNAVLAIVEPRMLLYASTMTTRSRLSPSQSSFRLEGAPSSCSRHRVPLWTNRVTGASNARGWLAVIVANHTTAL